MIKLFCVFILLISNYLYAQKDFIEDNTSISNAIKLRDPFKAPKTSTNDLTGGTKVSEGVFSNLLTPETLTLSSVKVKGVLLGKRKRVILTSGSGDKTPTYMLSEGSRIANGTVELKAILPSGVIFVEQITNVYGQVEYLETVVPISK